MVSFSRLPWATIMIAMLAISTVQGQLRITDFLSQLSGARSGSTDTKAAGSEDAVDGETNELGTGSASTATKNEGSRVGPFFLFRSSADNAEVVNEAFRGTPVMRAIGLAFGDEFPKLRDDLIERSKSRSTTTLQKMMGALTNLQNWSFDRDNNKKEMERPFVRPSRMLFNSLRGSLSGLGGSLRGLGLGGLGGLGLGGSASTEAPAFKISIDK